MKVAEKNRREIEERFKKMGDYVRIDYLTSCLKQNLDFDTRKFVLVKLAGLFENKKMYGNAGKMFKSATEINVSVENKIEDFMKAGELFVRGDDFDEADACFKSAGGIANAKQREEIQMRIREIYKTHAKFCVAIDKRNKAMKVYEKLYEISSGVEKNEFGKILLQLYEKLGKIRDYNILKKQINRFPKPSLSP